METMLLKEIAKAVSGKIINYKELKIDNISTDTRKIKEGDLFIALAGENFDGHNFLEEAFKKGAKAAIVAKKVDSFSLPLIEVNDTTKALQDLAHYYRKKFDIPVVAVTGSTGKTTTKDFIASVLSQKYKTLKTAGNFNNEIGLPLSLLRLDSSYQAAVLEMGMRGLGEIEQLAEIALPDIGVVTNVGLTHIERLGSQEKIAQAKSELVSSLADKGIAILNGDDQNVKRMASLAKGEVIFYGLKDYNKIRAMDIVAKDRLSFKWIDKKEEIEVELPIPGRYNVYNALAAIAVAKVLALNNEEIKLGLEEVNLTKMRNQILENKAGFKIINDTYNANPTSMRAAINTLVEISKGKKIALLGDMLELGEIAKKEHKKLGAFIAKKEIDYLFTIGELGAEVADGAKEAGMKEKSVYNFQEYKNVTSKLLQLLRRDDTILVKASRGMKLEKIVDQLLNLVAN